MLDKTGYDKLLQEHLDELNPIFARAAVGDFSEDLPEPDHEDAFTSIQVGIQIMLDVIREKIEKYEEISQKFHARYQEKNAILQSVDEGVAVLDKEGKVTFINHAAQDLIGWIEQEAVGKVWTDLVPLERVDGTRLLPNDRPASWTHPSSTAAISSETLYYVPKNGIRFPVSITSTPVVVDGATIGLVVGFRDLTKEKAVEELKEDFLSLATHQLRSPLVTMRWTLEALFENENKQIPPELRQKLDTIYQNNQHMIGLVNDILSVSRINQNRLLQQKQPGNLVKVLNNTLLQLQVEANHQQIKFDIKIEDEALNTRQFLIDAALLSHCVENVIENAVKYSKPGGVISIKLATNGEKVCLTVADQGLGIPEADKEHIFEKFYRGQNVAQLDVPGSGLGLFVVKSIVESWRGSISISSKENVGTTVTMCIPFEVV